MFTRYGRIGLVPGFLLFALLLLYARVGAASSPTIFEDDFNSYAAGPSDQPGRLVRRYIPGAGDNRPGRSQSG